jgi:hypothetical protein
MDIMVMDTTVMDTQATAITDMVSTSVRLMLSHHMVIMDTMDIML